jgi:hypothetical protein
MTTYTATYLDAPKGPGITKTDLTIEPCDLAARPEFDTQLRAQITEWTKQRYFDARDESRVTAAGGATADPDVSARNLYEDAKKCAAEAVSENGTALSVTASLDQDGQGSAVATRADGSTFAAEFDHENGEEWSQRTTEVDPQGHTAAIKTRYDSQAELLQEFDPRNTHPYDELDIREDSTGKPTGVQLKLDKDEATRSTNGSVADLSVIGQVFGSAIGRILAPDNQFGHLLGGTVGGLIGQKLVQNFAASLNFDASKGTNADFATFSGLDVASAAAGSVASF